MALLIIGLLLVAVGGLLLYLRSRAEGRLLEIGFTETVTAQEVRDLHAQIAAELGAGGFSQFVELKGKLRCAAPLTAELSGQPCAYYTMSVEERYEETYQEQDGEGGTRTATRTGSNIVASNTQSALFQLHDATGELDVNPTGAEIHPRQTVSRFEPFAGGPSITMGGFVLQVGVGLGGRRVLGYHYTEAILPLDSQLYLLGEATDTSGQLTVQKPREKKPFIISLKTEEELVRGAKGSIKWYLYGAIAAFVIGAVFILAKLLK
ncbi:MAG: E3 ubiquitin ligase family protein [Chlorobi bacterium]|nr:E3 ubiquitin ligase family protein [Chlorobiota bacterium]